MANATTTETATTYDGKAATQIDGLSFADITADEAKLTARGVKSEMVVDTRNGTASLIVNEDQTTFDTKDRSAVLGRAAASLPMQQPVSSAIGDISKIKVTPTKVNGGPGVEVEGLNLQQQMGLQAELYQLNHTPGTEGIKYGQDNNGKFAIAAPPGMPLQQFEQNVNIAMVKAGLHSQAHSITTPSAPVVGSPADTNHYGTAQNGMRPILDENGRPTGVIAPVPQEKSMTKPPADKTPAAPTQASANTGNPENILKSEISSITKDIKSELSKMGFANPSVMAALDGIGKDIGQFFSGGMKDLPESKLQTASASPDNKQAIKGQEGPGGRLS